MKNSPILRNRIKNQLLDQIMKGELMVGKTINLASLSRKTGISVTPIREALSQLEQARIIQAVPNRGFIVAALSGAEAKNLYETIAQLEVMALESSLFTETDVEALQQLQKQLKQATDPQDRLNARFDFHHQLVHKCSNPILLQLLSDLKGRLLFYEHGFGQDLLFYDMVNDQNESIIQAIAEDNVPTAALILKMNWMMVSEYMEAQVEA